MAFHAPMGPQAAIRVGLLGWLTTTQLPAHSRLEVQHASPLFIGRHAGERANYPSKTGAARLQDLYFGPGQWCQVT